MELMGSLSGEVPEQYCEAEGRSRAENCVWSLD
jgi:hypothetical protein